MRSLLLLHLLVLPYITFPQTFKEKELKTEIKEVTVFLNSAQIFESGTTSLTAGKHVLKIAGLPPHLEEKSIQVKGEGDFMILSVNHKLNFLKEVQKDAQLDSLRKIIDGLDASLARENARLGMLAEKQSLLNANKSLGGTSTGLSITQLKQAIELYENEILKIKEEEIRIAVSMAEKRKEKERLERQLKVLHEQRTLPTSEIEVRVSAEAAVTAKFRITYLVGNAGWFPKYDIRVENIKKPLQITYKAEVYQNTGADWKNVKLRFSNGNPNQSGLVPKLNTWNINFARHSIYGAPGNAYGIGSGLVREVRGKITDQYGQIMPGVNVLVKGTTIGTVTDAGGNYSLTLPNGSSVIVVSFIGYQSQEILVAQSEMNIVLHEDVMALQEVVVTGYGTKLKGRATGVTMNQRAPVSPSIPTTVIENQTTVEIEVNEPYTIKSNGEKLLVDLRKINMAAIYQYYAIPKLDKDAFLVARIVDWDQHNFLEGEANLYFEDAYVGRSILDAKSMSDTLDISLGRDKNIIVGREKNEQFCKRRTIGSNVSESRGFKITVRNKKSQPVHITVFDQIPVSVVSDISVSPEQLSGGQLDVLSGKVTWDLNIDAQQQKELDLQYEVRYPRKEKVILE